ncbi:MAG: hypothetical protein Alpg2KO_26890 [Alphaproteobacteria bacterium]
MKMAPLSPVHIDRLFQKCLASLPKNLKANRYPIYERTTRVAVESLSRRISVGMAPDLVDIEMELRANSGVTNLPAWLVRSRVVLVFRDAMRDTEFRRRFNALRRGQRTETIDIWSQMAADLYRNWPDKKMMGKPETAIRIMSGEDPILRGPVARAISHGGSNDQGPTGFFTKLVKKLRSAFGLASRATAVVPLSDLAAKHKASQQTLIPPKQVRRKRPSADAQGAGNRDLVLARPRSRSAVAVPQNARQAMALKRRRAAAMRARANGATAGAAGAAGRADQRRRSTAGTGAKRRPGRKLTFNGRITKRFTERGLAPVALRAAVTAARVLAEFVRAGKAPAFHDVEYEVVMRAGDAIAQGAVRTWTLHAYMECMRDPWFRDLFNALPLDERTETVANWAKNAATWFDVPEKFADFWIRALSGGDPVLARAAEGAFRTKPKLKALPGKTQAGKKPVVGEVANSDKPASTKSADARKRRVRARKSQQARSKVDEVAARRAKQRKTDRTSDDDRDGRSRTGT